MLQLQVAVQRAFPSDERARRKVEHAALSLSNVRAMLVSSQTSRPVRVGGLPADWLLLKGLLVGAASVVGVAVQFLTQDS